MAVFRKTRGVPASCGEGTSSSCACPDRGTARCEWYPGRHVFPAGHPGRPPGSRRDRVPGRRGGDGLRFEIESWARAGDRLADLLYNRLRLAKEIQLNMWSHFCVRAAALAGGRLSGGVIIRTRKVQWPPAGTAVPGPAGAPLGSASH